MSSATGSAVGGLDHRSLSDGYFHGTLGRAAVSGLGWPARRPLTEGSGSFSNCAARTDGIGHALEVALEQLQVRVQAVRAGAQPVDQADSSDSIAFSRCSITAVASDTRPT